MRSLFFSLLVPKIKIKKRLSLLRAMTSALKCCLHSPEKRRRPLPLRWAFQSLDNLLQILTVIFQSTNQLNQAPLKLSLIIFWPDMVLKASSEQVCQHCAGRTFKAKASMMQSKMEDFHRRILITLYCRTGQHFLSSFCYRGKEWNYVGN